MIKAGTIPGLVLVYCGAILQTQKLGQWIRLPLTCSTWAWASSSPLLGGEEESPMRHSALLLELGSACVGLAAPKSIMLLINKLRNSLCVQENAKIFKHA
jgi:hypothetical protein